MVIVLLGILATAVLPRFFSTSVYDERFLFDQLRSTMRYAQKAAVASGCQIRLQISSNAFSLLRDDNCLTSTTPTFSNAPVLHPGGDNEAFNRTGLPAGITLPSLQLTFLPDGQVDSDASITVGTRIITVNGSTGFIQ